MPRVTCLLPVHFGQSAYNLRLRHQESWNALLTRAPSEGFLAHREPLKQGRMGPLIGFGHDVDLLNPSGLVDLPGKTVFPCEFVRRPRRTFLGRRIFVVLSLE